MKPKQLELFKYFTLAQERNDAHTSACAMLRDFMEQMDLDNIKLMLSDVDEFDHVDAPTYFERLQKAFLFMRMAGNTELESAEGRCNLCHPGVASFTFKGNNTPFHISFLFHVKDDKVIDVHECRGIWSLFPELDGEMMVHLVEPVIHIQDSDWSDDDPPF